LLADGDRPKIVLFDDSPAALEIASTSAGRDLVRGGPLTPDQIVYAGSWPMWLEPVGSDDADTVVGALRARLESHLAATGATPSVVVAAGLGLFIAADTERFAVTAREVIVDAMQIAQGAAKLGGVRALGPDERRFIEEWEAEAYRRGIEASAPVPGGTT
jgi:rhamnose utilization protein RhaD (predicted bifunctional aldolase and dehydrogenase)